MIIGLSGYAQSGKDTVAGFLTDYQRRAFADPIRDALLILNPPLSTNLRLSELVDEFGWDIAKTCFPEVRRLLQVMGKEIGREMFGQNVWVDIALKGIKPDNNIVFTDVRFHNEANAIKFLGGQIWRVKRDGVSAVNAHSSETQMDDWKFDQVIRNDGTLLNLGIRVSDAMLSLGVGV